MKKISLIIISYIAFAACTVSLDSQPTPAKNPTQQKLNEKIVDEECKKGNSEACELDEWIQKKKKEQNKRIIDESGIRDRR